MADSRKKPRDKPKYPAAKVRVGPNYKQTPKNPLLEYARQRKPQCAVCVLPERDMLDAAWRQMRSEGRRYGPQVAREGLMAHFGYSLDTLPSENAFHHHFCRHVHQ